MDPLQRIIIEGANLLRIEQKYNNKEIVGKLETLGYKISESSFSKITKEQSVGFQVLKKASVGIQKIIKSELGHCYDKSNERYIAMEASTSWSPQIISLPNPRELSNPLGITFFDTGRISIQEKVDFINTAKYEIVEMGARLKTFVDYFQSRSDHEFAQPLRALLEKGIDFKLYVLDPYCNEALLYFNDRAKILEEEGESIEVIKIVIKKLKKIGKELMDYSFPGKFELYLYKHVPYNHFFIVDGETQLGEIMVSNYLYGIKRADCPIIKVSKQSNRSLYRRYYLSFIAMADSARKVNFDPSKFP